MKNTVSTLVLCMIALTAGAASDTMRAVVVTDGNAQIESIPIPVPQAGQVRIKVHAASVNPTDGS